mgnify:CR=1 FL=1
MRAQDIPHSQDLGLEINGLAHVFCVSFLSLILRAH